MAALADEIFLYLDWPGREAWRANLLEFKLFQSYRAGEEIFRRIEALLRTRDPADSELAKIYLMAIALGFRGQPRGRGAGAGGRLPARALHLPDQPRPGDTARAAVAVPGGLPEQRRGVGGAGRRLSAARRWLLAGLLLALVWILVSHRIWLGSVEDLSPLVDEINEAR